MTPAVQSQLNFMGALSDRISKICGYFGGHAFSEASEKKLPVKVLQPIEYSPALSGKSVPGPGRIISSSPQDSQLRVDEIEMNTIAYVILTVVACLILPTPLYIATGLQISHTKSPPDQTETKYPMAAQLDEVQDF